MLEVPDKLLKREKTNLILLEAQLITSSIFTPHRLAFLPRSLWIYICRLKVVSDRAEVTEPLTKRRNSHTAVALSRGGLFEDLYFEGDNQMRLATRVEKGMLAAAVGAQDDEGSRGASTDSAPARAASSWHKSYVIWPHQSERKKWWRVRKAMVWEKGGREGGRGSLPTDGISISSIIMKGIISGCWTELEKWGQVCVWVEECVCVCVFVFRQISCMWGWLICRVTM